MTTHTPTSAAQQTTGVTTNPPLPPELGPDGTRKVLGGIPAAPLATPGVEDARITGWAER
jgi:hypothetical protein